MSKTYELNQQAPLIGGMLIKQRDLCEAIRATQLYRDSRHQAQRLLARSQAQADELKQLGYQQGYGEGLMAGLQALGQSLDQISQLQDSLRNQLEQQARDLLQAVLPDPVIGLSVLQHWLDAQPPASTVQLTFSVPRQWYAWRQALQPGGCLPVAALSLNDGAYFEMRYGEQIYRFAPEEALERLLQPLQAGLDLAALRQVLAPIRSAAWQQFLQTKTMGETDES